MLADFDNDGALDLYEANGNADGDPQNPDDEFAEPNMLFNGSRIESGVHFDPVATMDGTQSLQMHTSRGLAVGDLDGDGNLDVVIANRDARPNLLMNLGNDNANSIRFRVLSSHGSDAIGATFSLTVNDRRQVRYVKMAGSYLASHDPHVHFGLNGEERVT